MHSFSHFWLLIFHAKFFRIKFPPTFFRFFVAFLISNKQINETKIKSERKLNKCELTAECEKSSLDSLCSHSEFLRVYFFYYVYFFRLCICFVRLFIFFHRFRILIHSLFRLKMKLMLSFFPFCLTFLTPRFWFLFFHRHELKRQQNPFDSLRKQFVLHRDCRIHLRWLCLIQQGFLSTKEM